MSVDAKKLDDTDRVVTSTHQSYCEWNQEVLYGKQPLMADLLKNAQVLNSLDIMWVESVNGANRANGFDDTRSRRTSSRKRTAKLIRRDSTTIIRIALSISDLLEKHGRQRCGRSRRQQSMDRRILATIRSIRRS